MFRAIVSVSRVSTLVGHVDKGYLVFTSIYDSVVLVCVVFLRPLSCVPNDVVSVSELSILVCPLLAFSTIY
jgi:hypothetical protein